MVLNVRFFPFDVVPSINSLVIKIAVNKDVPIPIIKVSANPLMGPVPNTYSIIPVNKLVILASMIADSAPLILKPSLSFSVFLS